MYSIRDNLYFWWHRHFVSKQIENLISKQAENLTCIHCGLFMMEFLNSPLVRHLLTYSMALLQPTSFDPKDFKQWWNSNLWDIRNSVCDKQAPQPSRPCRPISYMPKCLPISGFLEPSVFGVTLWCGTGTVKEQDRKWWRFLQSLTLCSSWCKPRHELRNRSTAPIFGRGVYYLL